MPDFRMFRPKAANKTNGTNRTKNRAVSFPTRAVGAAAAFCLSTGDWVILGRSSESGRAGAWLRHTSASLRHKIHSPNVFIRYVKSAKLVNLKVLTALPARRILSFGRLAPSLTAPLLRVGGLSLYRVRYAWLPRQASSAGFASFKNAPAKRSALPGSRCDPSNVCRPCR